MYSDKELQEYDYIVWLYLSQSTFFNFKLNVLQCGVLVTIKIK